MKSGKFAVLCCAFGIATGMALAADPNPPTVIKPTSGAPNGIAPNGITATKAGVFFTQPFTDGIQVPRGVYTISIPGGAVSNINTIPSGTPPVTAENSVAIVPAPAGSGFIPGDVYATGVSTTHPLTDAVYKNGSLTPFIDNLVSLRSHHQIDVAFDTVGSFNGAMIVTNDSDIGLYNSTGTLLAQYVGPLGFVLQHSTVAPLSYAACPGCIFVTAMPNDNINNPNPTGDGEILTVSPGAANGSAAVLFTVTKGIPEPESINFVTADTLKCTVGGFTLFGSGYADSTQVNNPLSTTGAILAWTPAQLLLAGVVGHYLVQNEEVSGGGPGVIIMDAGLATQKLFSDTKGTGSNGYQLEDTALVQCNPATGCPATQGFWHKASHWPTKSGSADGVTWNATTKMLTIGMFSYTQDQILELLPSGSLHTGGVENDLSQFIAAALNLIAGAQHTATIDAIIATIAADLGGTNLFVPAPLNIPSQAQTDLAKFGGELDAYNSATGLGCSEGAGLSTGK